MVPIKDLHNGKVIAVLELIIQRGVEFAIMDEDDSRLYYCILHTSTVFCIY